ncbi:hypothetical protein Tco_1193776 [Tanacetum coccineum]
MLNKQNLILNLFPKRKDWRLGNKRLNPGKIQREPTFQVILDALALTLTLCYTAFLITVIQEGKKEEIQNLIWKSLEISSRSALEYRVKTLISLSGKTTSLDKLRLSRAQILWGMYHQKNVDYVELLWEDFIYQIDNKAYKKKEKIFVSAKEETQIYGAILPESLTSPEMKETKAYKTYLVSTKEPTGKSKRVKRPANNSTKAPARDETKITDKVEGDKDEEMDYTTSQLYDDVDIRVCLRGGYRYYEDDEEVEEEDVFKTLSNNSDDEDETKIADKAEGLVQEEGTDAAMTNVQQGNENPDISQVIEDAHVTLSTIPHKTEVPVSSSSHSSDLAAKFLNFLDIPTINRNCSPIYVQLHHEVPSKQTPTLLTVPVSVITDSSQVFSTVIPHSL